MNDEKSPGNYDLGLAWGIERPAADFLDNVHPAIRAEAGFFLQSLAGIGGIHLFLQAVVLSSQYYRDTYHRLCMQRFGHPHIGDGDDFPNVHDEVRKEFLRNGYAGWGGGPVDAAAVIQHAEQYSMPRWRDGHPGVPPILSACILIGWTAFESFVTDLWVRAVDYRPSLAANVLGMGKPDATIPLEWVVKNNFDLSGRMGQTLKDRKRVQFLSLHEIKSAYDRAFVLGNGSPSRKLADLFAAHFPTVSVLESLRNLISHRAGRVDQKFLQEVKAHSPAMYAMEPDKPVRLTGEIVRDHVNAGVRLGVGLCEFASDWLKNPPE